MIIRAVNDESRIDECPNPRRALLDPLARRRSCEGILNWRCDNSQGGAGGGVDFVDCGQRSGNPPSIGICRRRVHRRERGRSGCPLAKAGRQVVKENLDALDYVMESSDPYSRLICVKPDNNEWLCNPKRICKTNPICPRIFRGLAFSDVAGGRTKGPPNRNLLSSTLDWPARCREWCLSSPFAG